jgi:hypothetical protein
MEEREIRNEIQSKNQKINLGDLIGLGEVSVMMCAVLNGVRTESNVGRWRTSL